MARFYSNENIALPLVIELRRLGHDVMTSVEAGTANASVPDLQVLAGAAAERRILITYNRMHFIKLHVRQTMNHSGIVVLTLDRIFSGRPNEFTGRSQKLIWKTIWFE